MKFSENGNFKKIFTAERPGFDAQELDAWCDAIAKDNSGARIRFPKEDAKQGFLLVYPPVTKDLGDILKSVAKKHTIDIGHHSGSSFYALEHALVAISEAGGRDAFIAQETRASLLTPSK